MASSTDKISVNLFDILSPHSLEDDGFRTFTPMVEPTEIDYASQVRVARGASYYDIIVLEGPYPHSVSVYTDKTMQLHLTAPLNDTSQFKLAWILECHEVHPPSRQLVIQVEEHYDYIFTFDEELLARGPKYVENLIGTTRILDKAAALYKKTKNISLIASKQNWCTGHKLRHEIVKNLDPSIEVDLWGKAYRPFPMGGKAQALAEYKYSIVVENSRGPKYFTEKIIDCFRTGTIPVYWGCPNIDKYFDISGIIYFENIKELNAVLPTLNAEDYAKRFESVKKNFELAKDWLSMDDRFARNLKKVLKEHDQKISPDTV